MGLDPERPINWSAVVERSSVRPRSASLSDVLKRVLGEGTNREDVARTLVRLAIAGDMQAIKEVFLRVDGAVPREARVEARIGQVIRVQWGDELPSGSGDLNGLVLAAGLDALAEGEEDEEGEGDDDDEDDEAWLAVWLKREGDKAFEMRAKLRRHRSRMRALRRQELAKLEMMPKEREKPEVWQWPRRRYRIVR